MAGHSVLKQRYTALGFIDVDGVSVMQQLYQWRAH